MPGFSVQEESKKAILAIWIMVRYLPIELHTPYVLMALGNQIGKTVALDVRKTSLASHVCICVEVNLSRELPVTIEVNSLHYEVTFENTHIFFPIMKQKKILEKNWTSNDQSMNFTIYLNASPFLDSNLKFPPSSPHTVLNDINMKSKKDNTTIPSANNGVLILNAFNTHPPSNPGPNRQNLGELLGNLEKPKLVAS